MDTTRIITYAQDHPNIIISAMAVALLLASLAIWRTISLVRRHTQKHTLDDVVTTTVTAMIMLLSGEGMFVMLSTKLDTPIPTYLAWSVCSLVEGLMIVLYREARKFVEIHGYPGPWGKAFWIVAASGGSMVAMSTSSLVEIFFRLSLPLSIAMLHWLRLVAGRTQRKTVTWLITPTRIAMRLGIITGEQETLSDAQRARKRDKILKAAYRLTTRKPETRGWLRAERKLRYLTLGIDAETAQMVNEQIERAYAMRNLVQGSMDRGQRAIGLPPLVKLPSGDTTNHTAAVELPNGDTSQPTIVVEPSDITPAPAVSAPTPRPALPTRQNGAALERDRKIMEEYAEVFRSLHGSGQLTQHRIMQTCGVGTRQARRVLSILQAELDQVEVMSDATD